MEEKILAVLSGYNSTMGSGLKHFFAHVVRHRLPVKFIGRGESPYYQVEIDDTERTGPNVRVVLDGMEMPPIAEKLSAVLFGEE